MAEPPNLKKYGVPLYSVAWIPQHLAEESRKTDTTDDSSAADQTETETQPTTKTETQSTTEAEARPPARRLSARGSNLVFAGGGGEGRSGIPNSVLLALFDAASNSLSDRPVDNLRTGSELPYRMAVHPKGDGVICAMQNNCRWFDWDQNPEIREIDLHQLEDVGQQLALAFNSDGTALAAGGEDGYIRVFKWPSMEIVLKESNSHKTVKDLHFSFDGKLLVSLGSAGPCRVWDISSAIVLTSLPNENGEIFTCCRFSQINDGTQVLYVGAMTNKGSSILTWNTQTWERMSSKHIIRDTITALNVSADGKFLAFGTPSGDVIIVNSKNMRIHTTVKKAHLGIVTALAFSPDSRALASVSLDSSARVAIIEEKKKDGGFSLWIAIFIILLAVIAYFMKVQGVEK